MIVGWESIWSDVVERRIQIMEVDQSMNYIKPPPVGNNGSMCPIKPPPMPDVLHPPPHIKQEEDEGAECYSTLVQRMHDLREKKIGIDVEFVLGTSAKSPKVYAHKNVLAAASEVFQHMLYPGPAPPRKRSRSETDQIDGVQVVHVTDVKAEAFETLINFLYSDYTDNYSKVDDADVLDTLHAAKKYGVYPLEVACTRQMGVLTPGSAVALLEQARRLESHELAIRCFAKIDEDTDEALASERFLAVDHGTMKAIIERSQISPSNELIVLKAVNEWSKAECARQKLEPTQSNKRMVIGDVLTCIRFPLMTVSEFGEAANMNLLTDPETGAIFRYISAIQHQHSDSVLPYPSTPRSIGRSKYVVKRFATISKNPVKKIRSSIWFIVDHEILVTGLGIYGIIQGDLSNETNEWSTSAEIELACCSHHMGWKERSIVMLKGICGDDRPILARFKNPVRITANMPHRATVMFKDDIETYGGMNGMEDIQVEVTPAEPMRENSQVADASNIIHFAFHNDDPNGVRRGMTRGPAVFQQQYVGSMGGFYHRAGVGGAPPPLEGCLYEGQIPEIHFTLPKTEIKQPK
ncbi:hypothetical protein AB6A40_002926 [Gnathostoma spinigerum]|uniref:BTB domain-containing protein n=1 Tax=Gnathostoma spinigerum TaxID=75299 RepID=A0ABD6EHR2_9BILA